MNNGLYQLLVDIVNSFTLYLCVWVGVYTARLTEAFTNRVSPFMQALGWGGGIGDALCKSGEITGEVMRDV